MGWPLVKFVLGSLSLVAGITAVQVWSEEWSDPLPAHTPLDKHLLHQSKVFRNQRNFYLTCLALALWWMVYELFRLKLKYGVITINGAENAAAAGEHSPVRAAAAQQQHHED